MISKLVSLVCGICLALAPLTMRSAEMPKNVDKAARGEWLRGLDYFEKGDKAREMDSIKNALVLFRKATSIFRNLKKKYPDWHPKLIDFRINLCLGKIDDLQLELDKKRMTVTDADAQNVFLREQLDNQKAAIRSLKNELANTVTKLEAAKREIQRGAASSANLESIMKSKAELEKKCALLQEMNQRLKAHSTDNGTGQTTMDKEEADKALRRIVSLEKSNAQLRNLLEKGKDAFSKMANEKANLEYKLKVTASAIDSLKTKLDAQAKIARQNTAAITRITKEKAELSKELDDAKKKVDNAKTDLAKLRNNLKNARLKKGGPLAKQLENENEILLKDLELAHLNLEKIKKQRDSLESRLAEQTKKSRGIEKLLAVKDKHSTTATKDAQTLRNKLFVSESVIKRQDDALKKEQAKYDALKKDFDALAEKYKNRDKRQAEFSDLARQSVELESAKRNLASELEKMKTNAEELRRSLKKNKQRMRKLEQEYSNLLADKANMKRKLAKSTLDNEQYPEMEKRVEKLLAQQTVAREEKNKLEQKLESITSELTKCKSDLKQTNIRLKAALEKLDDEPTGNQPSNQTQNALAKENELLKKKLAEAKQQPAKPTQREKTQNVQPDNTGKLAALEKQNAVLKAKLEIARARVKAASKKTTIPPPAITKKQPSPHNTHGKQFLKLTKLATTAENNGKKDVAIWYYKKALTIAPDDPTVSTKLGYIYAETGNDEKAVPLLEQAVAKDGGNIDALLALAFCRIRRGENYLALGAAAKANAINPKDPRIQRYLGIICDNLGWKDAAEQQFKHSFNLDPTSSQTAYNAAALLSTLEGRRDDAALWYKKALELGAERDQGLEKILKIKQTGK